MCFGVIFFCFRGVFWRFLDDSERFFVVRNVFLWFRDGLGLFLSVLMCFFGVFGWFGVVVGGVELFLCGFVAVWEILCGLVCFCMFSEGLGWLLIVLEWFLVVFKCFWVVLVWFGVVRAGFEMFVGGYRMVFCGFDVAFGG